MRLFLRVIPPLIIGRGPLCRVYSCFFWAATLVTFFRVFFLVAEAIALTWSLLRACHQLTVHERGQQPRLDGQLGNS